MSITQQNNPAFNPELTANAITKIARLEQLKKESEEEDLGVAVQKIISRAPNLPPSTLVPLAKSNISNDALDALAATAALKSVEDETPIPNNTFLSKYAIQPLKKGLGEGVYDPIKWTSRNLIALGDSGTDVLNNLVFGTIRQAMEKDQKGVGFWEATRIGQFAEQYKYQGEGFFQPERQRLMAELGAEAYRGTYDFSGTGEQEAWTIGRAVAEPLTPDKVYIWLQKAGHAIQARRSGEVPIDEFASSAEIGNKTGPFVPYRKNAANSWDLAAEAAISGLVDGAINIFFDPTLIGAKAAKIFKFTSKGIKALSGASDAADVTKLAKAKQLSQASLDYVETLTEPAVKVIYTPKGLRAAYLAGKAVDVIPDAEATFAKIAQKRKDFNTQRDLLEKDLYNDLIDAGVSPTEAIQELKRQVDELSTLRSADETKIWDEAAITSFIKRDKRVRAFFDMVVDVEQGPALSYRLRHYIFRNRINIEQSNDLANIVTKKISRDQKIAEVEQYFLGMAQRLKQTSTPGLFPTEIKELTGQGIFNRFVQKDMPLGGLERGISNGKLRKFFFDSPNTTPIIVDGSAAQRAASVHNFRLLLSTNPSLTSRQIYERLESFEQALTKRKITLRTGPVDPVTGLQDEIQVLGGAIGKGGTPSAIYTIFDQISDFMEDLLKNYGFTPQEIKESLALLKEDYMLKTQYAIDAAGRRTDFGLFSTLIADNRWITAEQRKEILDKASRILQRPARVDDLQQLGPSVNIELLNSSIMLPDLEAVRQLTSSKIYRSVMWKKLQKADLLKTKKHLRFGWRFIDNVVNDVWKPMILMNHGYIFRNILEGQARLMFLRRTGVAGIFTNPARYIMALAKQISPEDLAGGALTFERLDELATKAVDELSEADKIFLEATTNSRWSMMPSQVGPKSTMEQMVQTKEWASAGPSERFNYINGVLDQMRLINLDPLQRLWAHLKDLPDDASRVDEAMVWLNSGTDLANKTRVDLLSAFENNIKYGLKDDLSESAQMPWILEGRELNAKQQDITLRAVVTKGINGRVARWEDVPELRAFMAQNVIPILDPQTNRALIEYIPVKKEYLDLESPDVIRFGLRGNQNIPVKNRLPSAIIKGPQNAEYNYFVLSLEKGGRSGEDTLKVIKVEKTDRVAWSVAGDELNYDQSATELIGKMLDDDLKQQTKIFPNQIGYAVRKPADEKSLLEAWQNMIQAVFNSHRLEDGLPWLEKIPLIGRLPSIQSHITLLEKLPTYRQLVWTHIMENLNLLAPSEIRTLVQQVKQRAKMLDMSPNAYLGGSKLKAGKTSPGNRFAELQRKVDEVINADQPATGTLAELNTYAHAKAKNDMQNLFFDSGQKKGFDTGVLNRLNFQFAVAQRVILSDAFQFFAHAPVELYKMEKAFNGATLVDLNPYDQRPGFFYKNPQNNQYYFKWPGTDAALSLASGLGIMRGFPSTVRPYIGAPVKGLNMGFQWFPAFGPVGQMTYTLVNKFLPLSFEDKEDLKKFTLPYGERPLQDIVKTFIPKWAQKLYSAFVSDADNMNNMIEQLKVDIQLALASSGEYDPSTPEGMRELDTEASKMARVMGFLLAANQYIGPATGTAQFEIQTKNGNYVSLEFLAKELRRLQERGDENSFETAIPELIELYGQAVIPYVSGKTRTTEDYSGLEQTKEFYAWEVEHQQFFRLNKKVAGYFAPKGSDWYWSAYKYHLDTGRTERLSFPEIYNAYTYAVGASKYRQARILFPTYLSDEQEEALRNYRELLHKEYPGYPAVPKFDTAKFPMFIDALQKAVQDPEVKDLDVTKAIVDYLELRQLDIDLAEKLNLPGLRSKAGKKRRAALAEYGRLLSVKYPEFARIWERELSAEVELVGEND